LAIAHRPGNDLFRKAIIGLPQASDGVQSHSIPIPATENSAACVAHLLPLRRQARDIFTGATSILVVTPVSSPTAPPSHILFGLFDLSPAEARVAQKIVQGSSVEEIASDHKISRETVRNQLKAIFAKTGTSRQAELVGLVMGTQIRPHGSS
jgi:DNA-binding CsgD family transcriptional regulator